MKTSRSVCLICSLLILFSCGRKDSRITLKTAGEKTAFTLSEIPLDKGFSEYITGYTSGIVHANSVIEIRFTPEFAALAGRKTPSGLLVFNPAIKGKSEWIDENTLVFRPSKLLESDQIYTGELNLYKLSEVEERHRIFPIRIQTVKKDFLVTTGVLECSSADADKYVLHGELVASDYINSNEVEKYLEAKAGRKNLDIIWDHSDILVHKFTVTNIERTDKPQELVISWDGTSARVKQKGFISVEIPPTGEFRVLDIIKIPGESQRMDLVFSDPVDALQEMQGLIWLKPAMEITININSNIISIFPSSRLKGVTEINIESSVKNTRGTGLSSTFSKQLDFTSVPPAIALTGKGIILPSSKNLIFPFKAANLKAVDLRIIRIFENNLPYFLQENDINTGYSIKRFGRPVYTGRIDLVSGSGIDPDTWSLYTIDLSEYINIEPGVLYKVELGMRRSYSLFQCPATAEQSRYEELLQEAEERSRDFWDDPDNYYEDSDYYIYYSLDFNWRDRNDPCKDAYYSPDKKASRNILASNLGLIAKKGPDNLLHVMVNDILTALPLNEVSIEVFDYQLQKISSGNTDQDGSVTLFCERKPFLIIAKKDKDRNYLKINDGSSLSMSSFDVSGNKPENGIKAFIYGERDVWRPGDSIFLSTFIKDMKNDLPDGHPVQFEFINPLDQRIDNQVQFYGTGKILVFSTTTSPDAVTGNYSAVIRIGGAAFTKRVRIETIKPNRLKINLSFPDELLGGTDRSTMGSLDVRWLNGAIAGNQKATVEYILKHTKTEFEKFNQYNFDDPATEFWSETVRIFDGSTDEAGNTTFTFDPGDDIVAPGMLNAVFTVKVSEKGGDESIIQSIYKYAPYPVFVGINLPAIKGKSRMLFTDTDNEVKIVTVDETGKPVNSQVEMTVYKISYRWWWESDEENLAYYISNRIYKPVIREKIATSAGEASFTFNIGKNEWGRYLIRATIPDGHSTGKILLIDWPWEYGMKGNVEGATLLSINADKEKYNPGDEIKLSFPAPDNARAIITIENATGVLDEMRVNTTKNITEVSFKARPEMAPNVYAYVTIIQPHDQTINDMPIRLYGVVPVMVEDPGTHLSPVISMSDEIRSQKPFEIRVSETNKKSMTYTLAVVDEGLLDITGFRTPDPWKYFYAREALGVQTWDLYDYVLGAFGGTLERIFAIGGDEAVIDRSLSKAQRFIPVVKFMGPFTLGAGKTGVHTAILPQYTGSVRTMVIAGNERAFGSAEKSVLVKDPLMILATAPRVVSPGDKVALPVTLFVQKEGISNVIVTAEGNNMITFDKKSVLLPVYEPGEKDTEFDFVVGEMTGIARIKVSASGGGETAVYEMEIEVRSPNPPETRSELKILKPGEKWESVIRPFGMEGTNTALIEVSSLPSINLEKRLDYLLRYPHGCTEQITSAAFPQLWLNDLSGNDDETAKTASANIKEAISKLATRQMNDGGIALWPGAYQPDNWVTSYTGHFMIEAERMGFILPQGFKQKWIGYQRKISQSWRYDTKFKQSANDQAYRLFTLALAGQAERGAMNRLRESESIPQLSRWLLAAAFAVSGRPEVAGDLLDVRNIETEREYYNYYYGSYLRDKAIILYTLTVIKNEEQALLLLKTICDNFNSDAWYSTQTLAWGLFSYMKFAEMFPGDKNNPAKINLTLNSEKTDHTIQSGQLWSKDLDIKSGSNTIKLENLSEIPVYANLVRKGVPLVSDFTKENMGLIMDVDYVNMNLIPVDQSNLEQGSDFMMVVRVTNNTFSRVDNIALTQMVPSGWEIQNTRLFEANYGIKENTYDYRDFRDDRIITYFGLNQSETKVFVMILNAAYKGEFYQPSVWCEAMYTENCYSRYPGNKVVITGQKIE
jgi:uncharacterized protein YfaS (alpha-2-macroglobulin family)